MVAIMFTLGGLVSVFLLPIQIMPKLASPYIFVMISLEKETDLGTLEKEVVFPIESVVSSAQYVDYVSVNTGTRHVRIDILLKDSAKEKEVEKLKEELNQKLNGIPLAMSHSEVKQYTTADNTFMAVAFVPADPEDETVRNELKNVVFPELARIGEVRSITDGLDNFEYNYKFELKPEKVRSLQSAAAIMEEIKSSFASSLLGSISYGGDNYRVRTQASISSAAQMEDYRLSSGERLGDVLKVSLDRPADRWVNKHNNNIYYEAELTISETASEVQVGKKVEKALKALYENTLKSIAYPKTKEEQELVKTIQVYLDAQCEYSETSRKLFVHRNTVKYRIEKTEELLNCSLRDPADSLRIRVALIIGSILKEEGEAAFS